MVLSQHSLLTSLPHCVAALCLILSSQKLSSPPTTKRSREGNRNPRQRSRWSPSPPAALRTSRGLGDRRTLPCPMVFSSDAGDKLVELGVATPFTEATSSSYYHRQQPVTLRRRGALQLPELRRLLDALKASRGWAPRGRWWLVETGPATRGSRAAHAEGGLRHPVAELMLYDRMVSNDVMDLARLLYVSKTTKYHSRT